MKIPNLKLTEAEVSQTIDLKKLLGVDVSEYPEIKEAIGQAIIDLMVSRTESGKDVSGNNFFQYSKEYKNSLAFKAFGKTNKVNLTQSGDMLAFLDIVENKGNTIKIGWADDEENAKAYNHNAGDTVPKRAFFGVTDNDLKKITDEFKPDLKRSKNDDIIISKINQITDFIIEDLFDE